jgi:chromosome partitioning protein
MFLIRGILPRSVDVWALTDIAGLVEEANGVREGLRAYAVLNAADPGTSSDNAAAARCCDPPAQGVRECRGPWPVREELTPRDPKACEELATLVSMVFNDAVNIKVNEEAME